MTLAERVSKKTLIAHFLSKHAEVVASAIIKLLISKKAYLHTIIFDNGKGFAYHAKLKKALGVDNYCARPYCLWERGPNEKHNGLIYQYLSNGIALNNVMENKVEGLKIS